MMDTLITVLQVLLTIFAGAAGSLRLLVAYPQFTKLPFQEWANDFKPQHVKLIGLLEVFAAIGMIIPMFLSSISYIAPLAAVGIALIMAGAMATHLRRSEYLNMGGNLVWLSLALFFAYSRLLGL